MQQPMETQVKTYDNAKDYAKDAEKMTQQGWTVQNSLDHQQNRSVAGKLFVPGGLFTKGKSQIVVTWQRAQQPGQENQMPDGLSLKQKNQWFNERGMGFKEQIQYYKDHPEKR